MRDPVLIRNLVLVALDGSLGAVARYSLSGWVQNRWGGSFPLGTLAVNVSGCLCIGLLMGLVEEYSVFRPETRSFLVVGILGGFTTFSASGYESFVLLRDARWLWAGACIGGNVVLGLAGVLAGQALARVLAP